MKNFNFTQFISTLVNSIFNTSYVELLPVASLKTANSPKGNFSNRGELQCKRVASKSLLSIAMLVLMGSVIWGQQSIPTAGSAVTQNFTIGNSATATLPAGFKIGTDWSTGTTATTLAAGTSGTGILNGTSSGGAYNFANGITASSTDRAIGFLTTGSYASPRSIMYAFTNNTGSTIASIDIAFDYEKYRSGSSSLAWTFFHGSTSTASTASTSGDISYVADANNTTISNPPTSSAKSFSITGLSISNGSTYYLRWTYTGSASANGQGVGIDNFSITANAASYTVTFNGNTSTSGSMSNQTASAATALTSNSFTRTGYTFAGWNTVAVGGGTAYANSASFPFTANTTLYAQWTANNNTITFDGNGFTGGSTATQTIATDATAALTANGYSRTGYTFAGWATSAGGAVAYANSASYAMGTANVTLYAQWTANNNTITFDGNGFTGGTTATQTIATAATAALTANGYTRTGYTFSGWNTLAGGGGTAYANSASYTMGTANVTLYAQWTANNNTITFNGNSSTGGSTATQTIATDATASLTANGYTRTGYTFAGWNTLAGGGGTTYANSASYTMGTANVTLYAQWTANTLTITYDSQGGTSISNGSTTTGGNVADPGNPTQAGFTFNGWFVASSGGSAITFPFTHGQTANFTLYAQWTAAGSPTLDAATLTVALSNVYGTASVGESFTASGTFLSSNITVTAQTGFEVSTTLGSGYGASVSVSTGTAVYIRFATLQNAGNYNGAVAAVLSSTGATPVNVLTSGSGNTASPKPLSITASTIASKDYDASTTAGAVTVGTLSGFVGTQTVTATGAASNYSSANAGTYNSVSITYSLSNGTNGGLAANYSLATGSATGIINPKALSITAPTLSSKVYDGTITSGTVTVGALSGLIGGQTLTVSGSASNYSSANVGSYSSTITYTLGNGSGLAANYTLAAGSATGSITAQPISISSPSLASKIYDGTTTPGAVTVGSLSGLIGGQTLTVSGSASNYSSANVGSYSSTITYTLGNGSGLAANYTLAAGTASGNITPKALSITTSTIASKTYDGSAASGTVTAGSLSGFVGVETVTVSSATGLYSDANVGAGKTATITYVLANGTNGGLATNYSLANTTATGNITIANQTIAALTTPVTKFLSDAPYSAATTATSGLTVTYSSNNLSVATVASDGTVTIQGVGTATITASQAGNTNYNAATNVTQALTVNPDPTIAATPSSLAAFTSTAGSPSTSQAFTVTGSNLAANITVTAPAGYEVSQTVGGGSGYAATQTLTPSSGSVSIVIYVRLTSSATGTPSGNIALTSTSATTVNIAVSGTVNNPNCLSQANFTATPASWLATSITYASNEANFASNNGELTTISVSNPSSLTFDLRRTSNATAKSLLVEISNTTQTGSYTTVFTYNHSNTSSAATTSCTVDLSAYSSNSTVFIKFRKSSATTSPWYLRNVAVNCTSPSIISGGGPLTSLSTTYGTASTATSFTLTGTGLSSTISIAALSGFEFSTDNSSFSSTLSGISQTGPTTIYVRLSPSANVGTYSGNIACSSGATSLNVPMPAGTISKANQTITFAATNTKTYGDADYSPGATSGTNTVTYASSNTLVATIVSNQVRLVGVGSTTITASQAASANYNAAPDVIQTLTVTPKTLTITGLTGVNRLYNATTTATTSGVAALSGVINSDVVNLGGSPTLNFANKNIGTAKPITITGYSISGAGSGNYTLTQPTGLTANVTVATLTVSAASANNKVYNATTAAITTGGSFVGVFGGDVVTLIHNAATFAQATVGTGIGVTANITTAGTDGANYTVTQPSSLSADITQKPLTISGLTANNRAYDATTTATLSGIASLVGVIASDVSNVILGGTPVANFNDETVGTGKPVTVSGYTISGSASGNYSLSQPSGLTADISSVPVPVINSSLTQSSAYGTVASTYTITASNSPTSYNATGLPTGLSINTSNGEITGTPTANIGSYNVSITATNIGGTSTVATLVYTITAKTLTITSASASNKVYDRTNAVIITGTLSGIYGSDVVILSGTGIFAQTGIGTAIAVASTSTLSGADAGNYTLTQPIGLTADITAKELTVSGASVTSKIYSGTDAATIVGATLVGVISPDVVTISGGGTFATANVGSGISVTGALTLGGAGAGNYTLTQPTGLTGNITTVALTITSPSLASKVYNGTNTPGAITIGTLSGLIGGETLTLSGSASNYSSANVGSYSSTITYTLGNGSGLAANYTLASGTASGSITPKALSITAPSIASKDYDASTSAGVVTLGTLTGFVGSETVTATASAAAYSSANVGSYNNVVVNYTLANGTNGGLSANYSLAADLATGVINLRALTITATDATKEIFQVITGGSGSTAFSSLGLQGGQTIGSVTIAYGAAAGSTGQGATAGTYTGQVTPSGATGGTFTSTNYSITYATGSIVVTSPNAMVLATFGSAVCENFSGLATSSTSSTMPTGWAFSESGSNANTTYAAGSGSSATGETYSFGTAGDRTLGGLRSGSLNPTYGARVFNNTGSTISTITVSYTGKTWRVGAASRSDRIDFQYSTNATAVNNGTWTDENNLDYANPGQAVANGSVLHSSNISYTMQGLSLAPGASIWIRWTDFDATGADDGMGVDDVCITPIVPCTAPDVLVFNTQPSNVLQDVTMSTVTVRAYCSATGLTATGYTGNITLSASGGGCGYTSQTVAAVNGIATFSSIVFTRSTQTGITLTAAASGFSNLESNTFNVTTPAGSVTTVSQQDFGTNTSLSYSTAVGGLGVFNASNTGGVSSSNSLAFYYNDCLTGASGSSSTATFSQSSGLTGLTNIKLNFSMAWGGSQLAGASCDGSGFGGSGLDNDDFIRLETRVNGGAFTSTFQLNGNSNKQYNFSASGISINHNANQIISSSTEPSAFTINLPAGTTSVEFRFTFKTNRRSEIIYLDNVSLLGNAAGTPLSLPSANAGISFNGCNGGANQLQGSATNTVGAIAYNWSPSSSLNNAAISNPVASNTATTIYTLTVTDANNCSSNSTVTVSVLNGTPGAWTGAENTDWFNCQNWAGGSIPSSSTNVVIPDLTSEPEIAIGTASCANITLNSLASLNMTNGASLLNVSGNFINNGTLSPGSGTIAFVANSGTQTIATGGTGAGKAFNNVTKSGNGTAQLDDNMQVNGNITISDGAFDASASNSDISVGGNWTSYNSNAFIEGANSTVEFNGTALQTLAVPGGEIFKNIKLNNTASGSGIGLQINNNLTVEGTVTFSSGKMDIGANQLTIGTALTNGTITGANSSKYVITNATAGGGNIKAFTNTNTAYVFPVGDSTNYSPMTVTFTDGPQPGAYITTTAVKAVHPELLTASPPTKYISRYWSVEPTGLEANPVYNVSFSYVAADEVGVGTLYPIKYSTSTTTIGWLSCPGSTAAAVTGTSGANDNVLKTFTWAGLTTFSDFTGAGDGSPLPVTWLNFDAQFNNTTNYVDVSWTTASEINNDYFQVMRSVDAVNFEVVGTVDGSGNSSLVKDYTFEDVNPLTGVSYYKIRQVDFNGMSDNTEIRAVSNTGGEATCTLFTYPNPLIGQDLTIVYSNLDKGNWEFRLVDITGKIVLSQNRTSELNAGAFTLNLEQLPAGIYLFQLNTQSQNFTRKITISK